MALVNGIEDALLVTYTLFPNVWPTEKAVREDVPWGDLTARIKTAATYLKKSDCPLISMAEYGDTIDAAHKCLRWKENVRRVYGVELDYDGERVSIDDAATLLQQANLCSILYTSPSHSVAAPRWRVLLPLSEPAVPEKRAEYVGKANQVLGGIASDESFVLSQSFYIGRVRGAPYEVRETQGRCIDNAFDILPQYPATKQSNGTAARDQTTDADLRGAFERGENRYQSMLKLSARWAARGMSADDIENALLDLLGSGSHNGDGIDLRTRARPMADSAVRKYGETRRTPKLPAADTPNQDPQSKQADWRDPLKRRGDGFLGDERNLVMAFQLAPQLAQVLRFNEFALNIEFARSPPWRQCLAGSPWTERDDAGALAWFQTHDIAVRSSAVVTNAALLAASTTSFHPVRTYLDSLVWDGIERLQAMAGEYFGAKGSGEYHAAIGLRFMVSAVARIFRPGCQADHVIVLEGAQGIGKTSAVRTLAVKPEWFAGNLPDIHSKDAPLQLLGRWFVEIAELKAVRNSQVEATKSFISETSDTFRPPYARRTAQFPRQTVFIGTTNESEYLRDRTGNRRYWPVKCARIDIQGLTRDRDQLWAEAAHEYRRGTVWHLNDHEMGLAANEQQARVLTTETEADVGEYLHKIAQSGQRETSVRDVMCFGLGLNPDDKGYAEAARKMGTLVAEAIELAGWEKTGRHGKSRRTMYRMKAEWQG